MPRMLWIDASAGVSAGRLAAAMIALNPVEMAPLMQAIKDAAAQSNDLDVHAHVELLPDQRLAHRLHVLPPTRPILSAPRARYGDEGQTQNGAQGLLPCSREELERALSRTGVDGAYADFAQGALSILRSAETREEAARVASVEEAPEEQPNTVSMPVIGTAHTPYRAAAPFQPRPENVGDGAFYVQVLPEYVGGVRALETFSHVFVLSYLDRVEDSEITVRPAWKEDTSRYGVFATRSPNRPSPIGLTRVQLVRVEGDRVYVGPLDLFDGTPVLDIKPFIRTLDGYTDRTDVGNDGWLEGSSHLELHRLGIPHEHPPTTEEPVLLAGTGMPEGLDVAGECEIDLSLLVGIAWGLQKLDVDMGSIVCTAPVNTGADRRLSPNTKAILAEYEIPHQPDTEIYELLTTSGAAILAAMAPEYISPADATSRRPQVLDGERPGLGLGRQFLDAAPSFGALSLLAWPQPSERPA